LLDNGRWSFTRFHRRLGRLTHPLFDCGDDLSSRFTGQRLGGSLWSLDLLDLSRRPLNRDDFPRRLDGARRLVGFDFRLRLTLDRLHLAPHRF
jgi:hypothetical protein